MSEQIFHVDYRVFTKNGIVKGVEFKDGTWPSNFLPRRGDTINVDSGLFEVVAVERSHRDDFNPIVYLKPLGERQEFLDSLASL